MRQQSRQQPATAEQAVAVWRRVEATPEWQQARTVLLYAALPDELPTASFIERHRRDKQLFLPRVVGDNLEIAAIADGQLTEGEFGIMEPMGVAVEPDMLHLAIVPGLAFTTRGERLGRGRGYYDRLLRRASFATIGVALDRQVIPEIPTEPHDAVLDIIITPTATYRR